MRGRHTYAPIAGALTLMLGVQAVCAQTGAPDELRFWTWRKPPAGVAYPHVDDGTMIPIMRRAGGAKCPNGAGPCCDGDCGCYLRTPTSVVNGIVAEYIGGQDLYKGELCILLQEAGQGDGWPCPPIADHMPFATALFLNWCDGYDATGTGACDGCPEPDADSGDWITPWMSNGICETSAWMDDFVAVYLQKQQSGLLPAPVRFHMDTEGYPSTWWATGGDALETFRRISGMAEPEYPADPRWSTEIVPGTTQSLEQLYESALADGMTPPVPGSWLFPLNQPWTNWYDGVVFTACDAAMAGAFYDVVEEAWPGIGTSNLLTSTRTDGLSFGPGTPERLMRTRSHVAATWYAVSINGAANMQAPEFYPVSDEGTQNGETPGRAMVRHHRANSEACLTSYGGSPGETLTPWVGAIGTRFPIYVDPGYYEHTKADLRALLAMLRGEGAREFLVWTDLSETSDPDWIEHWWQTDDVIDQVWGAEVTGFVLNGVGPSSDPLPLTRSDWDWVPGRESNFVAVTPLVLQPRSNEPFEADLTVDFASSYACDDIRTLDVIVDGRVDGPYLDPPDNPVATTVALYNWTTGAWDTIDATAPSSDAFVNRFDALGARWLFETPVSGFSMTNHRTVLSLTDVTAWHHVGPDGDIRVRVSFTATGAYTVNVDHVQVVASDETLPGERCRVDCHPLGGDGTVDVNDLVAIIGAWSTATTSCDVAPACGDGVVDINDMVEVIRAWGDCP